MSARQVLIGFGIVVISITGLAYGGAFEVTPSAVSPGSAAPDFRAVTLDAHPVAKSMRTTAARWCC